MCCGCPDWPATVRGFHLCVPEENCYHTCFTSRPCDTCGQHDEPGHDQNKSLGLHNARSPCSVSNTFMQYGVKMHHIVQHTGERWLLITSSKGTWHQSYNQRLPATALPTPQHNTCSTTGQLLCSASSSSRTALLQAASRPVFPASLLLPSLGAADGANAAHCGLHCRQCRSLRSDSMPA